MPAAVVRLPACSDRFRHGIDCRYEQSRLLDRSFQLCALGVDRRRVPEAEVCGIRTPAAAGLDLKPNRFDSRGGTGTRILSKWVRSLGVVDKRISPNYSWRHRIKTLGRPNDLAEDILDAMIGHARRTVADTYGEFYPDMMLRELSKILPLELQAAR